VSSLTLWLTRLSRHAAIYAAGSVSALLVGLVSVALTTRFLAPSGFGKLGILLSFGILLTVLYNMGSLQGTFARTFGQAGDDGDDNAGDDGDSAVGSDEARDKRRALGSGLVLCCLTGIAGTIIVAIASPFIASMLTGDSSDADLVILAAVIGALGALWRLSSNVIRLERRPVTNVAITSLRPLLVAGGALAFLAAGAGIGGALVGNAAGSALAVVLALGVSWRSYRPTFDRRDMAQIVHAGRRWIPLVLGFWVIHNGDLFLLSRFLSDHDVGVYRFATRISAVLAWYVGAIMMAWNPLRRTSTFIAAIQEHGPQIGASLVLYYWLSCAWLLVGLTAGADLIVRLGAPSYASAASLVPLTGASVAAYGGYMAIYRGARYDNRPAWHVWCTVIAAVIFIVGAIVLVPLIGTYGAPLASVAAFVVAILITTYQSQHGRSPLPLQYGRIFAALALGAACVLLAKLVAPLTGPWESAIEIAAVVLYPIGVLALRLLPREHRRPIWTVVRSSLTRQTTPSEGMLTRLAAMVPADRAALELMANHAKSPAAAGRLAGIERHALLERLTAGVRRAGDVPGSSADEARIARYLFSRDSVAERDLMSRELISDGIVSAAELAKLERTVEQLRRIGPKRWRALDPLPQVLVDEAEFNEEGLEEVVSSGGSQGRTAPAAVSSPSS